MTGPLNRPFGAPDALATHLERLEAQGHVLLVREPDRLQFRGVLEPLEREYGDLPQYLEVRPVGEGPEESWLGKVLFVSYRLDGADWSFRSVVRALLPETVRLDAPTEVRPWGPPPAGKIKVAHPGADRPGYTMMAVREEGSEGAREVIDEVAGGDLFLRDTRSGHHVNHPAKVREMLAHLEMTGKAAVTLAGAHHIFAANIASDRLSARDAAYRLNFIGRRPDAVEATVGTRLVMTIMSRGCLYSLPARVAQVDGPSILCTVPKEVWRYQRRAVPRFRVDQMQFRVSLLEGTLPEGRILDMSLGGLGAEFPGGDPPPVGQTYSMRMAVSSEHSMILRVICVNARIVEGGVLRVGLQFDGLESRQLRVLTRIIQKCGRPG